MWEEFVDLNLVDDTYEIYDDENKTYAIKIAQNDHTYLINNYHKITNPCIKNDLFR